MASICDNQTSNSLRDNSESVVFRLAGKIPARFSLYLLSWSGFIVSFIIRCDINLTILAMVKEPKRSAVLNSTQEYCYTVGRANDSDAVVDYGGTLDWSPDVQSSILGAFYWVYIFTQIIGGAITQRFGTKRVFGYAQLACALSSFCIPWASEAHYGAVIALKLVQGLAGGLTWPAMYSLIGHWIPVEERSRFMSSFQGYTLGTGLAYALCGFLIANFGWKSVFYTSGSVGVVWCVIWYYLAFDSPETHPRISPSEKEYIRKNTDANFASRRQHKVPWVSILRSMPVWAMAITSFGRVWILYTFTIYGPQYMKSILGFDIEKNGLLSGSPFILCYVTSLVFCSIADKIIAHNVLSKTNTRKLFTAIAQVVPGFLCILLGYLDCNITAILVVWYFALALLPASFAGAMINAVDIAPNFGGPVLGFAQTVLMSPSALSPLTAGYLTRDGHTLSAWRTVFNISGGLGIATYVVYQIWGTAEIQPWNYGDDATHHLDNEGMLQKGDGKTTKDLPS